MHLRISVRLLIVLALASACSQEITSDTASVGVVSQAQISGTNGTTHHLNLGGFLGADTMIATTTDSSNGSYGGSAAMQVGSAPGFEGRGLLWFYLSMLPAPVNNTTSRIDVTNATLTFDQFYALASSLPIKISTLGMPWSEGTQNGALCASGATWSGATWLKPNCAQSTTWSGGTNSAVQITTATLSTAKGVKTLTLPATAIEGYNLNEDFKGLLLQPSTSGGSVYSTIVSREGWLLGQTSTPPQLDIDYVCTPGYGNDATWGPGGCTGDTGKTCREDGQCASGSCFLGRCMGDNGATCASPDQCISGRCSQGKCVGFRSAKVGATKDTYVQTASELNRGGANELLVGTVAQGTGTNTFTALVDVDLPTDLPAPVVINGVSKERIVVDSVKLKLNEYLASPDGRGVPATLRRIQTSWVGGTDVNGTTCASGATQNKPDCASATTWPSGFLSAPIATALLTMYPGQKVWDLPVTEVAALRGSTHNGFQIDLGSQPVGTYRDFASTEGVGVWGGPAPTLVVNYHCAAGYNAGGRACLGEHSAACASNGQCDGNLCTAGQCCSLSCSDVECGSVCGQACNKTCPTGKSCQGNYCVDHCTNGVKDADEVHIDCGGPTCTKPCDCSCTNTECGMTSKCGTDCGSCPAGQACITMQLEDDMWGECVDHCNDGYKNYGETAVDCGGGGCGPCTTTCSCVGKLCGQNDGCGNACTTGTCAAPVRPAATSMMNDRFTDAMRNSIGDIDGRWVVLQGTPLASTTGPAFCGASTSATAGDVYFHFHLCAGGNVTIDTTTSGTSWSAAIGLFKGNETGFSQPSSVTCSDGRTASSKVISRFLPGGDYYVVLHGNTSTTNSLSYAISIRDDKVMTPVCGGAGVPGSCGVINLCDDPDGGVLASLGGVSSLPGQYSSTSGQEGFSSGALSMTTTSSATQLFFEGFEQPLTRWNSTTNRQTASAHADTVTGRASSNGTRVGTTASTATVTTSERTDLTLSFDAREPSGGTLTAAWSVNSRDWFTITTVASLGWVRPSVNFTVTDKRAQQIFVRFINNGSYSDVDNVQITSRTNNFSTMAARTSGSHPSWAACDANGNPISTPLTSLLTPPAATDTCPAMAGPCICAPDPGSASKTCNSNADCTGQDETCERVPRGDCLANLIPVTPTTPNASDCTSDAQGYVITKYCLRPFQSCGAQPPLGCFDGATSVTSNGVTYNRCNDPSQEPCKMIYECPAPDAVRKTPSTPTHEVAMSGGANPAKTNLSAPTEFQDLIGATGVQDCNMSMVSMDAGKSYVNTPSCNMQGGRVGTRDIPLGIFQFGNCNTTDQLKTFDKLGDPGPAPGQTEPKKKFDIDFKPIIYKHVAVKDLPFGEADIDVSAGMSWMIKPTVWGNTFDLFGVEATAAIDRCQINVRADGTVLGQDIDIANLITDGNGQHGGLPVATPSADVDACRNFLGLPRTPQQVINNMNCKPYDKSCIDAFVNLLSPVEFHDLFSSDPTGLIPLANKAKKALTDARRVTRYYHYLRNYNRPLDTTLCNATKAYFNDPNVVCDYHAVNAWIGEYTRAATALTDQLNERVFVAQGLGHAPLWMHDHTGTFTIAEGHTQYKALAVSFTYPIGPLSALMEVSAQGDYGVSGLLSYSANPATLLTQAAGVNLPSQTIASASATVKPEISAWVTVFVGVGVGNDFLGAHVGVQGDLMLLRLGLPVTGIASLQRTRDIDTRQPDLTWGDNAGGNNTLPAIRLGPYYKDTWTANYDLGASLTIDALDGKIDLAARIHLLLYTLQFNKTIAHWSGLHDKYDLILSRVGSTSILSGNTPLSFGVWSSDVPLPGLSLYNADPKPAVPKTPVDDPNLYNAESLGMNPSKLGWANECATGGVLGPD